MIFVTAVLLVIVCVQQAQLYLQGKNAGIERSRLLSAVLTSSPAEFVAVERAIAAKPKRKKRDDSVPVHPIGL